MKGAPGGSPTVVVDQSDRSLTAVMSKATVPSWLTLSQLRSPNGRFGDFYTRGGLTLAQRELLVLCALATIGDTAAQLGPHGRACIQAGNTKTVVAALVHCFPYIGFPRAVAAIRAVKDL